MNFRIRYRRAALKDLEGIMDYIRRESLGSAVQMAGEIDHGISHLSRFPLSGLIPRDLLLKSKGYRVLVIQNYLVFYRLRGRTVLIYRMIHGRREYAFLI